LKGIILLSEFFQVLTPSGDDGGYLHVPPVKRQWLISPPCSPPADWEQPVEKTPSVDLQLLAAMAQLAPGKSFDTRFLPVDMLHLACNTQGYSDRWTLP
jgi:hypothetical protein